MREDQRGVKETLDQEGAADLQGVREIVARKDVLVRGGQRDVRAKEDLEVAGGLPGALVKTGAMAQLAQGGTQDLEDLRDVPGPSGQRDVREILETRVVGGQLDVAGPRVIPDQEGTADHVVIKVIAGQRVARVISDQEGAVDLQDVKVPEVLRESVVTKVTVDQRDAKGTLDVEGQEAHAGQGATMEKEGPRAVRVTLALVAHMGQRVVRETEDPRDVRAILDAEDQEDTQDLRVTVVDHVGQGDLQENQEIVY